MLYLHLAGDRAMILVHAMVSPKGGSEIQIRYCWAMAWCTAEAKIVD